MWGKARTINYFNTLQDTVRGAGKTILYSNTTDAENAYNQDWISSFTSDGFDLASGFYNESPQSYVAWCWDAGSSTVTNTQGSITSQVRANPSAGFSIVSYTAQSSGAATIGHGLNVAPSLIILRGRTIAYNWAVYHSSLGNTGALTLNSTAAFTVSSNYWNDTSPTSTVFTGGSVSAGSGSMIAYCFAPVDGYSSFGSYVGNGSATDGPFVYTGFRPALVIVKMSSSIGNWTILDYQREGYNVDNDPLFPNLSNAEGTTDLVDLTSNGFKVRTTDATFNTNAGTYVYAAWAQNPFQYARAR